MKWMIRSFLFLAGLSLASSSMAADVCFTEADGFLFQNQTQPLVEQQDGSWRYRNTIYRGNFMLKVVGEFEGSDGESLLYTRVYAPGYDNRCSKAVFKASDVYHFSEPRPIDRCLQRTDGFVSAGRTSLYHKSKDGAWERSNSQFTVNLDFELLDLIDRTGQDDLLVVMIDAEDYRPSCYPAAVNENEVVIFGEGS